MIEDTLYQIGIFWNFFYSISSNIFDIESNSVKNIRRNYQFFFNNILKLIDLLVWSKYLVL